MFKKYYKLVDKIFGKIEKKEHAAIFKDAKNYLDRDEFAFLLDKIIRKCNENPEVSPIEKLGFITQYNPYYIEEKYLQSKVDVCIFESLDLNSIDDKFITYFREKNFEIIFKEYNFEYIKMFIDKIKNISNIDTVIKLININKLSQKRIFLDLLNKSYDNIITKELEFLSNDQKLKEAYHIIAKLAIINYVAAFDESKNKKDNEAKEKNSEAKGKRLEKDKKFDFINKRVKETDKKLNKNISSLIFIEIINILFNKEYKNDKDKEEEEDDEDSEKKRKSSIEEEYENIDFNDMKDFIFLEFSNKLEEQTDIDNIIKLIDCLKGKDKKEGEINTNKNGKEEMVNEFLEKLISKNLFTKDEFFQNSKTQNLKISLLIKLYEKKNNRK